MAEINLRPYQSKAVAEIREALAKYRRCCFVLLAVWARPFVLVISPRRAKSIIVRY